MPCDQHNHENVEKAPHYQEEEIVEAKYHSQSDGQCHGVWEINRMLCVPCSTGHESEVVDCSGGVVVVSSRATLTKTQQVLHTVIP